MGDKPHSLLGVMLILGGMADRENETQPYGSYEPFVNRLRRQFGIELDSQVVLDSEPGQGTLDLRDQKVKKSSSQPDWLSKDQPRYSSPVEIARGGMGIICRVWDGDLRRELAMKVVRSREGSEAEQTSADRRLLMRFIEEAQITGQLEHPGIVSVHDVGFDASGRVYFTMQLVRGQELTRIIELAREEQEGWSRTRALGALLKVCEAMSYAHAKGVIHRDLKPANVMVGRFGEVFVMDWGVARVLGREDSHDLRLTTDDREPMPITTDRRTDITTALRREGTELCTMDGDVVGTPAYMSPEQAIGRVEEVDQQTDVYAVGAMLYHLLSGVVPYQQPGLSTRPGEVLMRVLDGGPAPVQELDPTVPAELQAICERAMQRDVAGRYPDMESLAEDLRAYLEHRVVQAYETGAVAELRKWIGRNRGLAGALAAAVLAVMVGLAAVSWVQARGKAEAAREREIAVENEQVARANAEAARKERARVMRLSAFQELHDLESEAEQLWPIVPEQEGELRAWLERARPLLAGLEADPSGLGMGHRDQLAALEERGEAVPGEELDELREQHPRYAEFLQLEEALVAASDSARHDLLAWTLDEVEHELLAGARYRFASEEDRWWYGQLDKLIFELERFGDPETGLLEGLVPGGGPGVARRLELLESIREASIESELARDAWILAAEEVALSDVYDGLELSPQWGLFPLGADPLSGLQEFAHILTGEVPDRDEDGRLVLDAESAVVLVLLPGAEVVIGAQSEDESGANYSPSAQREEGPTQLAILDPFLLSKYELTQAQWLRFTGVNPARYNAPGTWLDRQITLSNPVENITWQEAQGLLERMGLQLPTEAQWEYGARSGSDGDWWLGSDREYLRDMVNLVDTSARAANFQALREWPDFHDGWPLHAPVGTFPANDFGLHDVIGNVREWCLEGRGSSHGELLPGQGLALEPELRNRAYRGGSFATSPTRSRAAWRGAGPPTYSSNELGIRPALQLQR